MNFDIRRLTAADAQIYRHLRLQMLQELPEAFGDSHAEAEARPEQYWPVLLSGERAFFGAFGGGALLGAANFMPETTAKSAHRGWLLGMYVAPSARGTGLALRLIDAVVAHARGRVIQVHLGVGSFNARARRLYEKAGFRVYGTQPRSLLVEGKYIDEVFMVRFLDKDGSNE